MARWSAEENGMTKRATVKNRPAKLWDCEAIAEWLPVGSRVRYLNESDCRAGRFDVNEIAHYIGNGSEGVVVDHIGGYAEHDCPDHYLGPGCTCGDDSRLVEESEAAPVVMWESAYDDGKPGPGFRQCVTPSDLGDRWEIA